MALFDIRRHRTRLALAAALAAQLGLAWPTVAQPISQDEARIIATEAYLYFYPLVTMDLTRKQLTNVPKAEGLAAPMNQFAHVRAYPTADMRVVVRPNFDTLYSSAWLDVSKEPVIVSMPDAKGRYYLLPMLDMWTDVFASPGWRTTGTGAQTFLIASPTWRPELRNQFETLGLPAHTQRIDAPTPQLWIIGRIKTDGAADYPEVHKLQDQMKSIPLSQWGKNNPISPAPVDASIDMKTPPKVQVDTMTGEKFFAYAAEIMKTIPPHLTDQPILAQMKRMGFQPGHTFDTTKLDATLRDAIAQAPRNGQSIMQRQLPTLAQIVNGWSMNINTMGVYGNWYVKRAIVSNLGLGANVPEDAIYPMNLTDKNGQALNGQNQYVIHFSKADLPPAKAFWSITLYDVNGFQVGNPLNRFAISSWNNLTYNADGSLDLYMQNDDPGEAKRTNWLPAPKDPFNLTMRLYAPEPSVLLGRWAPPFVEKRDAGGALSAQ